MPNEKQVKAPAQKIKKTPVVLVVEDNPDTQVILHKQLTHAGFRSYGVFDGETALSWLKENTADLVLLDWMMPGMSGIEVCSTIRKQYSTTELPILILSARGENAVDRVQGLQAGANDFMAKPYSSDELLARVQILTDIKLETEQTESLLSRYTAGAMRLQAKIDPDILKSRQRHHAIVMFADLRGFTHLTAHNQPEQTLRLLDEFFEAMMQTVDKHGGIVFDLAGDELLAAFNVPYQVPVAGYLALSAAIEMQKLFRDLQKKWSQAGIEVGLGIGIHEGDVILGNVGAAELLRYTIMGSVVNIAHRLVEKALDGDVIISPELYETVKDSADKHDLNRLDNINLKGVDKPQTIYRLHV